MTRILRAIAAAALAGGLILGSAGVASANTSPGNPGQCNSASHGQCSTSNSTHP